MQTLDIPFPESEYQIMSNFNKFNFIYLSDHPLCKAIQIDMMIRALSFPDPEYAAFLQNDKSPQEMIPVGGRLFEIGYIRECTLSNVTKLEWENNYGPSSPKEFARAVKGAYLDSYVKIINLKMPTYNLKELNKKYGQRK